MPQPFLLFLNHNINLKIVLCLMNAEKTLSEIIKLMEL